MQQKVKDDAQRIKQATLDMPLHQFGFDAVQHIGDHWRSRPTTRHPGANARPLAISTAKNQCKIAKAFIRWLDRSDAYDWQHPRGYDIALKINEKRLRTEAKRSALAQGPQTWPVKDLVALYRHATDRERALILFGLNFGFAQSEIITLRTDEIDTRGDAPILKRIRHKSEVYSEFALWPQTMRAIDWLAAEHAARKLNTNGYVYLTERGRQPNYGHISNTWTCGCAGSSRRWQG